TLLQLIPEHVQPALLPGLLAREAATPLSLLQPPLLRPRLFRLAPEHHVLSLTLHHIAPAGWPLGAPPRALEALYAAPTPGLPSPPPEPPLQYADFAAWQRGQLPHQLPQLLDFWRSRLHDAPPFLDLPADRPRPPVQRFSGQEHRLLLDQQLSQPLASLARAHGATLFMALLRAFAALLAPSPTRSHILTEPP